eukprot:6470631-Amphidinium_carterae.1
MSTFLLEINKQLSGSNAALASGELGRVKTYLQSLYLPRHPIGAVGMRNAKELAIIAEVLDDITNGNLSMAGDKLVQRFKAIQKAISDQSWAVAQHLEVAGIAEENVLTTSEQRMAMKEEKLRVQLRKAAESSWPGKGKGRSSGSGGSAGAAGS